MVDQSVRITSLPDTTSGSIERVAMDLAVKIDSFENVYGGDGPEKPREYWLRLYADCVRTVSHRQYKPS